MPGFEQGAESSDSRAQQLVYGGHLSEDRASSINANSSLPEGGLRAGYAPSYFYNSYVPVGNQMNPWFFTQPVVQGYTQLPVVYPSQLHQPVQPVLRSLGAGEVNSYSLPTPTASDNYATRPNSVFTGEPITISSYVNPLEVASQNHTQLTQIPQKEFYGVDGKKIIRTPIVSPHLCHEELKRAVDVGATPSFVHSLQQANKVGISPEKAFANYVAVFHHLIAAASSVKLLGCTICGSAFCFKGKDPVHSTGTGWLVKSLCHEVDPRREVKNLAATASFVAQERMKKVLQQCEETDQEFDTKLFDEERKRKEKSAFQIARAIEFYAKTVKSEFVDSVRGGSLLGTISFMLGFVGLLKSLFCCGNRNLYRFISEKINSGENVCLRFTDLTLIPAFIIGASALVGLLLSSAVLSCCLVGVVSAYIIYDLAEAESETIQKEESVLLATQAFLGSAMGLLIVPGSLISLLTALGVNDFADDVYEDLGKIDELLNVILADICPLSEGVNGNEDFPSASLIVTIAIIAAIFEQEARAVIVGSNNRNREEIQESTPLIVRNFIKALNEAKPLTAVELLPRICTKEFVKAVENNSLKGVDSQLLKRRVSASATWDNVVRNSSGCDCIFCMNKLDYKEVASSDQEKEEVAKQILSAVNSKHNLTMEKTARVCHVLETIVDKGFKKL